MKEKKNNKKYKSLIILVLLLVLIIGGSFAWLRFQLTGANSNVLRAGSLSLKLDESATDGILIEKAIPVSDTSGLSQEGYTFSLVNNGSNSVNYTIYLDDLDLEDGETRMPDNVVKYSLTKNDTTQDTAYISSTGENPKRILDSGTIEANTTNNYTLKVWIASEAKNEIMGSVFYTQLRVEAEQANIPIVESDLTIDMSSSDISLGLEGDITNYTIESSDPTIATVDSNGNIVATGYGVVTFNVQDKTTGSKQSITVTVTKTVTATYATSTGVESIDAETGTCVLSDKSQTDCALTIPNVTVSSGYTFVGWNTDSTATTGLTDISISEDTILYPIIRKDEITYTAKFNASNTGVSSFDKEEVSCTIDAVYGDTAQATSCKITLPEIEMIDGYTFIGWSDVENATTGEASGTEIELSADKTYYAVIKKDAVTLSAIFYRNGANSLDNNTSDSITKTCVLDEVYNDGEQATECVITTPSITASEATPTVIGYNTNKDAITSTLGVSEELTLTSDNDKIEYYAITKSELKTYVATFYRNGAKSLDGDETSDYIVKQCNISATYNGVKQDESCNITSPVIEASDVTPKVLGYSSSSEDHTSIWDSGVEQAVTEENSSYYAQTIKEEIILNVEYKVGSNVSAIGKESDSCTIEAAYNGTTQDTSCSLEAPSITPKTGYTSVGWSTTNGDTTGSTSITLTKDETYYANASANSYTVEYYKEGTLLGSSGVKVDESLTLTSIETLNGVKEGYSFKGWATDDTTQTVTYTDKQEVSNLATTEGAIVKLYAVYVDDIAPVCVSTVDAVKINTTGTTTITYTCTDLGSGISATTLTKDNFTISDSTYGEVTDVSSATEITANKEYEYTVTVTGLSVGEFNVSLNEGTITDTIGNKNEISKSTNITVEGITYYVEFTVGDNVTSVGSTTLSCTTTGSNTTCDIDSLPEITVSDGYVILGWYDSKNTDSTSDDELIGQVGDTLTLSSNMKLIANARVAIASEVSFDSSVTSYDCTDVQCAIDELNQEFE